MVTLLLLACSEYDMTGEGKAPVVGDVAGAADIVVEPPALDFGSVT